MTIKNNGSTPNPLDAWAQSIESPPHQVGGRARSVIENARRQAGLRDPNGNLYPKPGQAVTEPLKDPGKDPGGDK
ncbi:MAG: hypothetical protein H7338_04545 [Candidatus Sericytochromatia bacterium]|nr:hypothetical protein [Candidatus Sericytochromatia bacterium]